MENRGEMGTTWEKGKLEVMGEMELTMQWRKYKKLGQKEEKYH